MGPGRRNVVSLTAIAPVLALVGGCAVGATPPAPAGTTEPAPSPAAPTASASPGGTAQGTRSVLECLNGRYRLTGFTSTDGTATYRSGTGGAITFVLAAHQLADGNYVGTTYRIRSTAEEPITLVTAAGRVEATVTLTSGGSYTLPSVENAQGRNAVFTARSSRGSATLTGPGTTRRLDAAEAAALVSPEGVTTVSCTASTLTLAAQNARFTLTPS